MERNQKKLCLNKLMMKKEDLDSFNECEKLNSEKIAYEKVMDA